MPRAGCGTRRLLRLDLGAPSARRQADALLTDQIRDIHARSRGTYGAQRVQAELRLGLEVRVGRKRVARLMREHGLVGVHRRRGRGLTRRDPAAVPAPDLVERTFTPPASDRLWVADITQQRTDDGWLYLAVVLDAFSRRIVGWSMATHLRTELVLDALDMAITQRNPTLAWSTTATTAASTPASPLAVGCVRPVWSPRWAPSATHSTTPSPRASSPPWNANYSTVTTGRPAKASGQRCSTSSRSSTTANAATRPSTTTPPSATSNSTYHRHQPHSQRVHESGATPMFDVCRAARLLEHLPDAGQALAEMARVTRRGGQVVVFDLDWDTLIIDHPDKETTRTIVLSYSDSIRNGWIGCAPPPVVSPTTVMRLIAWRLYVKSSAAEKVSPLVNT